jgi:hypothetical protein
MIDFGRRGFIAVANPDRRMFPSVWSTLSGQHIPAASRSDRELGGADLPADRAPSSNAIALLSLKERNDLASPAWPSHASRLSVMRGVSAYPD